MYYSTTLLKKYFERFDLFKIYINLFNNILEIHVEYVNLYVLLKKIMKIMCIKHKKYILTCTIFAVYIEFEKKNV